MFNSLGSLPKFSNQNKSDLNEVILDASLNSKSFVFISINMFTLDLIYKQKKFPELNSGFTYTIDSRILFYLLKILKPKVAWRHIPGAEVPAMLLEGNEDCFRVLLVGASSDTNRTAIEKLKIDEIYAIGDCDIISEAKIEEYAIKLRKKIDDHQINLVIVCLGQPKQEILAVNLVNLGANIPILCVGAFADFYAGSIKRSPKILNRLGLEWLWRLLKQPRRMWKRYLFYSVRGLYLMVFRKVRYDQN